MKVWLRVFAKFWLTKSGSVGKKVPEGEQWLDALTAMIRLDYGQLSVRSVKHSWHG